MSSIRLVWDFILGALLIGGAPMCVIGLASAYVQLYEGHYHRPIPYVVEQVIVPLTLLGFVLAAGFAIWFRLKQRLLSRGFLAVEIVTGLIGFFGFGALVLLMYGLAGIQ